MGQRLLSPQQKVTFFAEKGSDFRNLRLVFSQEKITFSAIRVKENTGFQ